MNRKHSRERTARRPRPTIAGRVLAGAVAVLLAGEVQAQSITGAVFHRDSTTRAAGVIVVVDDERGTMVARGLSGDNGGFDLRVPAPGTYVVRLLRIGFRPTVLGALNVPARAFRNSVATPARN